MEFIEQTINWVKGEIFEATIFGSFGVLTILCGFLFWKFGLSPNSRAVVIPLVVVGLFFLVTAISGILNNNKRLATYAEAFQEDRRTFVLSEKKRVEDFQYLYKMTVIIASVSFSVAIGIFFFTNNHVLRAIGLALILFGLTGLTIDYFSKERADEYYKIILKNL